MTKQPPRRARNETISDCCVCVQSFKTCLNKITENFVTINSKFVSIREIIFDELKLINYKVNQEDEIGMMICESCQNLIVSFYLFKLKTKKAQEVFHLSVKKSLQNQAKNLEESIVLHTLDIVKNFIDNQSIQLIIEEGIHQRLIIERQHSPIETVKQETSLVASLEAEIKEYLEPKSTIIKLENSENEEYVENDFITHDDGSSVKDIESFELQDSETQETLFEYIEDDDPTNTESFVLENIEFIERTPEYLIQAYKPSEKQYRTKDPDNWIRNKLRNARVRGEQYTTKSGKKIPAKRLQSPCNENCRLKCRTKISEEDRQKNFDQYWERASFILQRKFIFEHHRTVPVQRRRFRNGTGGKPRQYSSQYFLDKFNKNGTSSEQVQVCERMFLRTFDICKNIVAYLHKKVQTGKVQDLRGTNRRKLSQGHEAAIEQIKANPFYHIEQPMPIVKMFKLYQQECADKGIDPVKNHTYRKLFADYNECDFLKREKIVCEICDRFISATEEQKKILSDDYKEHIQLHERCKQRAKGRIRQARKAERQQAKKLMEKQEPSTDNDMIVEEHLSYENEEIEYS